MTTIIRPHSQRHTFGWCQIIAIVGLLTMVSLGVLFYNQIVNLQHHVQEIGVSLATARATNIELKNQLYQQLDTRALVSIASRFDLIEIRNPEFLELETRASSPTLSRKQ